MSETASPSGPASAIRRVFVNGTGQRLDFRHRYIGRIVGQVTSTSGGPAAGVTVRCHGQTLRDDLTTRTRDEGSYELTGLPPGRYYLQAEGWPYFMASGPGTEVPETSAAVTQDFVLEPGGWIQVRIVTAEGKPVTATDAGFALQVGLPWGERWATWARKDGTVGTPLLKPGTHVVRVRPEEAGETAWWETEPVTVTPGQATQAVIELPPGR